MPVVNRTAPDKTHTQSVVFYKSAGWTEEKSRAWCKEHEYYVDGFDETENTYRFRQYDPDDERFRYRNQVIKPDSIYLVVGYPKSQPEKYAVPFMRVKIAGTPELQRPADADVKRLKQSGELTEIPGWRILGLPYGGPLKGRDTDGETFHEKTDTWISPGDKIKLTYYHGLGPDSPDSIQAIPAIIGEAEYLGDDQRGHWFGKVKLDSDEPLAQRIMDAEISKLRASSGAVGHLVRTDQSGLINVWPLGELALFDTNEWRLPANDFAVIEVEADSNPKAAVEADEAKAAATEVEADAKIKTINIEYSEVNTMDEKLDAEKQVSEVKAPERDLAGELEQVKAEIEQLKKAAPAEPKGAPVVIKKDPGKSDYKSAFYHWIRTGDASKLRNYKVEYVLEEGDTATESGGGYAVPDDQYSSIIAKRDEESILSKLGVRRYRTRSDKFNFPIESTSLTKFAIVAESGAISDAENEPVLGQVPVTIYKFNKLIKISEELLEDENSNLEAFLNDALGRALADTENYYALIGDGTGEPQGAFYGGTAALTLDSASAIGAKEIPELMGKLGTPYHDRAAFVMNPSTYFALMGLTGDPFQFGNGLNLGGTVWNGPVLAGHRVVLNSNVAAIGASAKSMLFGNFDYYAVVENRTFRIQRLNELYAGNGQIGLLASVRFGGAVLQAEAFQYATHPTA